MATHVPRFFLVAFIFFIGCGGSDANPATDDPRTIPCEPRRVLQSVCWQCHVRPPVNQAPFSLIDRGDILARRGESTIREQMIDQVERQIMPAPPAMITDADKTILLDWLKAGAPDVVPQECASDRK